MQERFFTVLTALVVIAVMVTGLLTALRGPSPHLPLTASHSLAGNGPSQVAQADRAPYGGS